MQIKITRIIVPKDRRPLDSAKVDELAASIKAVGLISAIGVRRSGKLSLSDGLPVLELVHGHHRLEACRSLGWWEIEATELNDAGVLDDTTAKMIEIAENLHRAELTTRERNEHLADWVALLKKIGPPISDAEQPISSKPGRKPSPAVAAVAKMSGLTPKTVKEAIKTTKVSPAVKAAADKAELSQKQRLAISRLPTGTQQITAIAEIAAGPTKADRAAQATPRIVVPGPKPAADRAEASSALDVARAAYIAAIKVLSVPEAVNEVHKIMDAIGIPREAKFTKLPESEKPVTASE